MALGPASKAAVFLVVTAFLWSLTLVAPAVQASEKIVEVKITGCRK
jgi:hypothetical protein